MKITGTAIKLGAFSLVLLLFTAIIVIVFGQMSMVLETVPLAPDLTPPATGSLASGNLFGTNAAGALSLMLATADSSS